MKNGPYELIIPPESYPGKRYRDRYAYEHTVVWWINTKTLPPKGFEIHHLNGNHRDNRFENLKLLTSREHKKHHGMLRKVPSLQFNCGYCGKKFERRPSKVRYDLPLRKFGKLFCSTGCGTKHQMQWRCDGEM